MKFIIKTAMGLSLLFLSAACQPGGAPASAPPTLKPADNEPVEGGITSGGGGTLPSNPISVSDVYSVLERSKLALRLYVNSERFIRFEHPKGVERFFWGERNLATLLEQTDIDVLADKPCKDKFGRDVDASIYGSKENRICLSAFRIAPKLIEEIADKEINALILHELSHLLGATESEAVEIQKTAVYLSSDTDYKNLHNTLFFLPTEVETLEIAAGSIAKDAGKMAPAELEKALDDLQTKFDDFRWKDRFGRGYVTGLALFDREQTDYYHLQGMRLYWASVYARTLVPGPYQKASLERYNKVFQGAEEVTFAQAQRNGLGLSGTDNIFSEEKIKRLHSAKDVAALMRDFEDFLSEQWQYAAAFGFDSPMPVISNPLHLLKRNPFEPFFGTYKVTSHVCHTDLKNDPHYGEDVTGFELGVNSGRADWVDLKVLNANGYGTDLLGQNAQGVMEVSGDANFAQALKQDGSRWINNNGRGLRQKINRISKTPSGFVFVRGWDDTTMRREGIETNFYSCEYTLEKTK